MSALARDRLGASGGGRTSALEGRSRPTYAAAMAAIAPILLFVIAVAAINYFEFHRFD